MQVGAGMKGWLIRAQQPRSKRISCAGQTTRNRSVEYQGMRLAYAGGLRVILTLTVGVERFGV